MRIAPSDDVTLLFYGIPSTALQQVVSLGGHHIGSYYWLEP